MSLLLFELSVDSLIAATVLAAVVRPRGYALLVALFGICDGGCSFIGALLEIQIPAAGVVASIFLILWGGLILLNLTTINRLCHAHFWPYLLPPLMGIDNLVRSDVPWATAGLTSSAMAALGLAIGFTLLRLSRLRLVRYTLDGASDHSRWVRCCWSDRNEDVSLSHHSQLCVWATARRTT